jgi:hypothetical protein
LPFSIAAAEAPARHRPVRLVVDLRAIAGDHHPVALLEIGDLLGQRSERQRIGAEVGLPAIVIPWAVADDQRRAEPRADQHVGMRTKGDGKREGAAQLRQNSLDRLLRAGTGLDRLGQQMGNDLGVGIALEHTPPRAQRLAQLAEVLDDAVVHQRHFAGGMGMGIGGGRRAMRRPARMGDARRARRRIALQLEHQIGELARRATADELAIVQRADAGAVIAAVFHPA